MKLLRVDTSVRIEGSVSRALGDLAEERLGGRRRDLAVRRRDLGREPLPYRWADALATRSTPNVAGYLAAEVPPGPASSCAEAVAVACALGDELLDADAYLFTVAMYNYSVPVQLKQWVDLIICDERAADTSVPILDGRPALVIVASGGAYGPGTPREGADHATPWIRTILESTWGLSLEVVRVELTMAEHNPAMADLVPLAEQLRRSASEAAAAWAARVSSEVVVRRDVPRIGAVERRTPHRSI